MLKKSLVISFIVIVPIVFMMGFTGLIAVSQNKQCNPGPCFFSFLFKEQSHILSIVIIALAIALTVSSIDTLINAISSLIIVDANRIIKFKGDYLKLSKFIIILLGIITLFVASKGLSILYLFLLADLLCCAAVLTIFIAFTQNL